MSDKPVMPVPLFGYVRLSMAEKPRAFMRPLMGNELAAIEDFSALCDAMLNELIESKVGLPPALQKYVDIGGAMASIVDVRDCAKSLVRLSHASQANLTSQRAKVRAD